MQTSYPSDWPESLQRTFESLLAQKKRVKISYEYDREESGYLSRTYGLVKSPILLKNSASTGGYEIGSKVVRISGSRKNDPVYWDLARDEPILFIMKS